MLVYKKNFQNWIFILKPDRVILLSFYTLVT